MLTSLSIRNYALIESLEISFRQGFSVMTGETGAGKSIILGAIGLLAGNRAETSSIREGASKCIIEGVFDVSAYDLQPFFEENDFEYDDRCIIRRELLAEGKSRAFINDTPASLQQLKSLGNRLIDIHSQHQNLLLNTESFQLEVIDTLAGNNAERQQYLSAYRTFCQTEEKLRETREAQKRYQAEEEFIRYQLEQFDDAQLKANELEELEEELNILSHSEDILTDLHTLCHALSDEDTGSVRSVQTSIHVLRNLSKHFPNALDWAERMENVYLEMKDISEDIEKEEKNISFEPQNIEKVEKRLDLIYSMLQKFHVNTMEELLHIEAEYRQRILQLDEGEEIIGELSRQLQEAQEKMTSAAATLTDTRKKTCSTAEKDIAQRLRLLGMPNVRFKIEILPRTAPESNGMDAVSFRFSANKGSDLQDIASIASGGEISRIMITIKALLAKARRLPTIIFDEIDTGISGNIADKMGEIMQEMGKEGHQIISITHLPQIAAKGTAHYLVSKDETDGSTSTSIRELSLEERIQEIASMMSGSRLTQAAVNNAKVLLGIHP